MQFYLFFPFIAILRKHISMTQYQLILVLLISGSIFYQINSSNPIIQYESLFCRLWQFGFGMLAETLPNFQLKFLSCFLLISVTVICFCFIALPRLIVSFFVVITVSSIISMSTIHFHPFNYFIMFIYFSYKMKMLSETIYVNYVFIRSWS